MFSTFDDDAEYLSVYEGLPSIAVAWDKVATQLGIEDTDTPWESDEFRKDILQNPDLISLLQNGAEADQASERQRGLFGFWILHRHFDLGGSERIVSFDQNIPGGTPAVITLTQPSTTCDAIVPKRWGADGSALEFKLGNSPVTPTAKFQQQFQKIMKRWGLQLYFGLCLSQTPVAGNYFLDMSLGRGTRAQITAQVDGKHIPQTAYQTTWTLSSSPQNAPQPLKSDIICSHRCVHAVRASSHQETKTASTVQNISDSIQTIHMRTSPGTPSGPSAAFGSRSTPQSM